MYEEHPKEQTLSIWYSHNHSHNHIVQQKAETASLKKLAITECVSPLIIMQLIVTNVIEQ
ncbi:unnamed protein product [Ixodes pacificus]